MGICASSRRRCNKEVCCCYRAVFSLSIQFNLSNDSIESNRIVSYRIVSYRIVSYRIVSYRIVSYRIVSYRIVSYRIVSYRIVSYRIVSYRIVSYRIVSYRIVSYRIVSIRSITMYLSTQLHCRWPCCCRSWTHQERCVYAGPLNNTRRCQSSVRASACCRGHTTCVTLPCSNATGTLMCATIASVSVDTQGRKEGRRVLHTGP